MLDLHLHDVWDLDLSTATLIDASTAWLTLKGALETTAETLGTDVAAAPAYWESGMATSYLEYAPGLGQALRDAAVQCGSLSTTIDDLVTDLTGAQDSLTMSLDRLRSAMPVWGVGDFLLFRPADELEKAQIDDEVRAAEAIVASARTAVTDARIALGTVVTSVSTLRLPWSTIATTGEPGWDSPDPASIIMPTLVTMDGATLVSGTKQNERITITVDPVTGETVVTIVPYFNHLPLGVREAAQVRLTRTFRIPAGEPLVINAGAGDDTIDVPAGTNLTLRFLGGDGNDSILTAPDHRGTESFGGRGKDSIEVGGGNDFVSGGAGRDYLDGGNGNDRLYGGAGDDVVYGMDGADVLDGGAGNDYLEGALGDDQLFGGSGDDQVSGGGGDDTMAGGAGDDAMFGGAGTDTVDGQSGWDTLHVGRHDTAQSGARVIVEHQPTPGERIVVKGSPEFVARVQADLDLLRSSDIGQHMLNTLDEQYEASDSEWWDLSKTGLEIRETDEWGASATRKKMDAPVGNQTYGVEYNPAFFFSGEDGETDWVPVVVMYHELGHVYQFEQGSPKGWYDQDGDGVEVDEYGHGDVKNIERQNIGLPWDYDDDSDKPHQPDPMITENAIRDVLNLPDRTEY